MDERHLLTTDVNAMRRGKESGSLDLLRSLFRWTEGPEPKQQRFPGCLCFVGKSRPGLRAVFTRKTP